MFCFTQIINEFATLESVYSLAVELYRLQWIRDHFDSVWLNLFTRVHLFFLPSLDSE
jgi:hypothetical protein